MTPGPTARTALVKSYMRECDVGARRASALLQTGSVDKVMQPRVVGCGQGVCARVGETMPRGQ